MKSAAEYVGKYITKKSFPKHTTNKSGAYLVKDFLNGDITECTNLAEVVELIGIHLTSISTYARNNTVYKSRYRITFKDCPDWTTDMKKINVKSLSI